MTFSGWTVFFASFFCDALLAFYTERVENSQKSAKSKIYEKNNNDWNFVNIGKMSERGCKISYVTKQRKIIT